MKEIIMPRGDKSSYTDKQKRQAEHIEESYEGRGVPSDEAERRAWATVNAETHGGKKERFGTRQKREPRTVPQGRQARRRGFGEEVRRAFSVGQEGSADAQASRGLTRLRREA
jgi:hypothetical protein